LTSPLQPTYPANSGLFSSTIFFKLDLIEISEKELIPESEILNYYQQNQFRFIEPKKVAVDYILLNENIYKDSLEVSTQEILDERILLEDGVDISLKIKSRISLDESESSN